MSSNQVYRNDLPVGDSVYHPMVGNNIYPLAAPQSVAPQTVAFIVWNPVPSVAYDPPSPYITMVNNGNINFNQAGNYCIQCLLSLQSSAPGAGHNVLGYTAQIFNNIPLGTNIMQKRAIDLVYHADDPAEPSIIVPLSFTGYMGAGTVLEIKLVNDMSVGSGITITVLGTSSVSIERLD
jgi:hypothetical protein